MPGVTNASEQASPAETDQATPFCRRCEYDLSASIAHAEEHNQEGNEARCPECGQCYVPSDPSTYGASAAGKLARFTVRRAIPIGMVVAVMVTAMLNTWIPIPSPLESTLGVQDWRCWVWRGQLYGWESRLQGIEVYHWKNETRGVRRWVDVQSPQGTYSGRKLEWSVVRDDERWKVEIFEPGVLWPDILRAWNATRDGIFGFRSSGGPTRSAQPFSFEGDEEAVLTELVNQFGVTLVAGWPRRPETAHVWIWHPSERRVVEVTRDDANGLIGYDPFDRSDPDHPEHVSPAPQGGVTPRDPGRTPNPDPRHGAP